MIVLAINEYSNHPGICLHVALGTDVLTPKHHWTAVRLTSVEMKTSYYATGFYSEFIFKKMTLQSRRLRIPFLGLLSTFPVSKCNKTVFTKM